MATYNKTLAAQDNARCDGCSVFDAQGFPVALDGLERAWVHTFGEPCEVCGKGC